MFTLPNGTSSTYNANQLWLADFSDNGGIYSFQFSESVLQSKVKNGSQECKRVYGVAPLPQSRMIFSDIDNFQIKLIDQDGIVSVIASSDESCRRYGVETRAAFGQPSAVCTEIETIFVADPAVSSVCMISSPAPFVTYLQKMITSLKSIFQEFPELRQKFVMKAFTTLVNQHFFSRVRQERLTPETLDFAQIFPSVVTELIKRIPKLPFLFSAHPLSYYEVLEDYIPFDISLLSKKVNLLPLLKKMKHYCVITDEPICNL